ncbi:MAG: hypothetical protein V4438_04350 [Patescibacteria group bacterium]
MKTYKVKPNRNQSPEEMLKATGYKLYTDSDVVKTIPKGEGESEMHFFKLDRYVTDEELEKEYTDRGLIPADPYSMLALPTKDLDEMKYVGTHWKDADRKWCFAAWSLWRGERYVHVSRRDAHWRGPWFFAGLRKLDLGAKTLESKPSKPLTFCPFCQHELKITIE